MKIFQVEFIGYNDGMPYLVKETTNLPAAQEAYDKSRKTRTEVGHRLIEIHRADGPLRQDDT